MNDVIKIILVPLLKSEKNSFKDESLKTLKLGLPVIAAQLLQMSMTFVDTVLAGTLSAEALAAVAVGGAVFFPFIMNNS